MKCVIVTVNDHTHLGGPMGSEYITPIETHVCKDWNSALKWAYKKAIKERPDLKKDIDYAVVCIDEETGRIKRKKKHFKDCCRKEKMGRLSDLLSIGFEFEGQRN